MLVECVKSTYSIWKPGERYELTEVGKAGMYTIYIYEKDGIPYKFGLDDALFNETDVSHVKFKEVK